MSRILMFGVVAILFTNVGCCRWSERWCGNNNKQPAACCPAPPPQACYPAPAPAYAPPPQACYPAPQPCYPAPPGYAR